MMRPASLWTLLVSAALVAGCEPAPTPESLLAQAREYRSKGEFQAALIQAKNAAQLAPDLAEAHFLKAASLLDLDDARGAEEEFRLSLTLKTAPPETVQLLAISLLKQRKFQDVLDELIPDRIPAVESSAELNVLRGEAYLGLMRIPAAKAAFEKALQLEADFPGALVGLGKITANDRQPEQAMQLVNRALAKSPHNFEALLFQGDLHRVLGDPEAALAAYEKVYARKPDDMNARLAAASLQVLLDKREDAAANLAVVLEHAPRSPTANYLQATLEFKRQNFKAAQKYATEVLKVQPTHAPTIILAGASEYAVGDYPVAERHLKWALDLYPDSLYVRKLLVAAYNKNKKAQAAIEAVQPALVQAPNDSNLLVLAGDVYMEAGQFAKATQYFEKALSLEPESVPNRLAVSSSRLAAGEFDRVIADLEKVLASNSSQPRAGIMLGMAYVRRKEFDKALELASRLERALPKNPVVRNLKGSAYFGKKDFARAKGAFEEALTIQDTYFPAVANLAQLDIRVKDFSTARNRYYELLDRDGGNVQAMLALADLLAKMPDKTSEAVQWADRARQLQPGDPRIALTLARYHVAAGNPTRALEIGRLATNLGQFDIGILEEAARLQLSAGGARDALDTYLKIARLNPKSADVQFRLAQIQYLVAGIPIAKQTVIKALELNPDLQEAQILLARLEATVGNRGAAIMLVSKIRKAAPNSLAAAMIEGDVEMLGKNYLSAAKAYERAYRVAGSGGVAAQVYEAYRRAGKPELGEAVVFGWLQAQPTDAGTRLYLADASMRTGRFSTAVAQYEWLARYQPGNQSLLNNLAWAYDEVADTRALATAEKAFKINETKASAADTYGWILYRNGRTSDAVAVLRRAVELAPESREIRYHFAQSLAKSGDRKDAREELQRVLAGRGPFDRELEAKALLEQLSN